MPQQDIFSAREFIKLNSAEKKSMRKKPGKYEERVQLRLCRYVKTKYPHVIFECDLASGTKLTIGQAIKHKAMRSNRGMPDFRIFYPSFKYKGLFIELKKEAEKIKKRNGDWKDIHIEEQAHIIDTLSLLGYKACFAVGLGEAVKAVDDYMSGR